MGVSVSALSWGCPLISLALLEVSMHYRCSPAAIAPSSSVRFNRTSVTECVSREWWLSPDLTGPLLSFFCHCQLPQTKLKQDILLGGKVLHWGVCYRKFYLFFGSFLCQALAVFPCGVLISAHSVPEIVV